MAPTPNGFRTAQVSVGTSATLVCAAKSDRGAVTIENHGTTDVYLGDASVTTGNGILLPGTAGASVTIETTAAIYGIVGSGSQTVGVAEVYS